MSREYYGFGFEVVIFIIVSVTLANSYIMSAVGVSRIMFGETIAQLCGWCKCLEEQVIQITLNVTL